VARLTEAWTMARHGCSAMTGGERRGGVDGGVDGSDATASASDRASARRRTAAVLTRCEGRGELGQWRGRELERAFGQRFPN
jgi:hypothetical protein